MSTVSHSTISTQVPAPTAAAVDVCELLNQGHIHELATILSHDQRRLSRAEATYFYSHPDLFALGELAYKVTQLRVGKQVYYNINRHINPTNICVYSCRFCSYAKKPQDQDAYAYSIDEIINKTATAVRQGADEIHMVGGLHPRWNLQHFVKIITAIKQEAPQIHLKGFTAVELWWLAKKAKLSLKQTLMTLKSAGLDSLPGGGAEIFDQQIRDQITAKMDANTWLATHETAHDLGLKSNATMLYGHVESAQHRLDHMLRLRELQDKTQGFNAFIPLAFQPHDNTMGIKDYTLGEIDLRTLALARLVLDNFKYIKAYWIMLGQDIAQLSPYFGANDLDGTVAEEKIAKAAGGRSGNYLSETKLHAMITATGTTPSRRDSIYTQFSPQPNHNSSQQRQPLGSDSLEQQLESLIAANSHAEIHHHRHQICSTIMQTPTAAQWLLRPQRWHKTLRAAQTYMRVVDDNTTPLTQTGDNNNLLTPPLNQRRFLLYSTSTEVVSTPPASAPQHLESPVTAELVMIHLNKFTRMDKLHQHIAAIRTHHPHARLGVWNAEQLSALCNHDHTTLTTFVHDYLCVLYPSHHSCLKDLKPLIQICTESNRKHSMYIPCLINQNQLKHPEPLINQLHHFADLIVDQRQLNQLYLSVIAEHQAQWMISEFLHLMSMIRLISPLRQLSTPFAQCPAMSAAHSTHSTTTQHPQEKILGLLASTACNDFGLNHQDQIDGRVITQIFRTAGNFHWQSKP